MHNTIFNNIYITLNNKALKNFYAVFYLTLHSYEMGERMRDMNACKLSGFMIFYKYVERWHIHKGSYHGKQTFDLYHEMNLTAKIFICQ